MMKLLGEPILNKPLNEKTFPIFQAMVQFPIGTTIILSKKMNRILKNEPAWKEFVKFRNINIIIQPEFKSINT